MNPLPAARSPTGWGPSARRCTTRGAPPAIFYGLSAPPDHGRVTVLAFELRATGPIRAAPEGVRSHRGTLPRTALRSVAARCRWPRLDTGCAAGPARLLRLLVETLTRARRLERHRHLTCRQLEVEGAVRDGARREGFVRLAPARRARALRSARRHDPLGRRFRAAQMLHGGSRVRRRGPGSVNEGSRPLLSPQARWRSSIRCSSRNRSRGRSRRPAALDRQGGRRLLAVWSGSGGAHPQSQPACNRRLEGLLPRPSGK